MQIFDVASRHMQWLALRQEVTASNIANANTPGYRSREVTGFEDAMAASPLSLAATNAAHLQSAPEELQNSVLTNGGGWDRSYSGNDVTLENELIKAGATSRMMSLDSGLTRTFHRMIMSSLKV